MFIKRVYSAGLFLVQRGAFIDSAHAMHSILQASIYKFYCFALDCVLQYSQEI